MWSKPWAEAEVGQGFAGIPRMLRDPHQFAQHAQRQSLHHLSVLSPKLDKLRAINIFIHILEAGSLTAAAEKMDLSLSAVVRALAGLERWLGVRLLNRRTRRMAVTQEGADYQAHCKEVLAHLAAVEANSRARQSHPSGLLRLTAPLTFGQRHLAPLVASYPHAFADMQIKLLLLDCMVDLMEENLDAAVRIGHLRSSLPVNLLLPQGRLTSIRPRSFIDWVGPALRERLAI
jgi:DNA-binding transcriptional LysR family regulator